MAKLPGYLNRQVTGQAVNVEQKQVGSNLLGSINQAAQGVSQLVQVQQQMQQREARDYTLQTQNKTSVALAEQKVKVSQEAKTGSEYTAGIKTFIEQQKAIALENAPTPKAAETSSKYYDNLMANELEKAIPLAASMNAKNTATAINESLEIGLNQTFRNPADFDESLSNAETVIDTSDLAPNIKEQAKAQYKEKLMTQKLLGSIELDPKSAVAAIESGEYDSLDPDSLRQITESAKSQSMALDRQEQINKQKQEQAEIKQQESLNAQAQSNLEIGVSRGELGYVEIEKAYTTGTITPEKRTQLVKQVDSIIDRGQKTNDNIIQVGASIDAGIPLDYRNKTHKTAVDDYYNNMPQEIKQDPNAIAALSSSTKVIPSAVEAALNAGLKGNPQQIQQAADIVSRINEQSPEVMAQLPEDTKTMGITVATLISGGVDPAKAVELANNSIYNTSKDLKSVLKTQLSQPDSLSKKRGGFDDAVDKISPSFFTPDRTQSMDRMEASFNYTVDQYYLKTHDMDSAIKLATADISKVWGSTWVNGKETMSKYPVEKIYGNGKESPWIYNQLSTELKEIGVEGKSSLQADAITAREQKPSYVIMVEQDGAMVPLLKDGIIQRFTPDFDSTPEKKEAEAQKEKAMEQARRAEKYTVGEFRFKTDYGVSR